MTLAKGEWFDNSDYEDLTEYEDNEKSLSLRDWQRRGKDFFFKSNGKVIFECSTGSGKTFFAINILQELLDKDPGLKILIVVPKNIILETGWYKELIDAGIPIQKIGVYYGDIKEYSQITLTNMQSIHKIPLELFDCVCLDEIHNYATKRMIKYLEYPFKYKIGLTATLTRMDDKHYNIMKIFDYNIFKYTAEEALFDGVLNPFVFINIGVKLDSEAQNEYDVLTQQLNAIFVSGGSFQKIMRQNSPLKFKMLALINKRKDVVNNYHEKFDIATQIILNHKDNKIIVFNQYNKQTSKLFWYLMEHDIGCRIVHSEIPKDKREQAIIDFRNNKYNVLLTTKVLDEGMNIPKLDVAIIMAGDSTDKQTIQRMGRVLRKKKGQDSILYQIYCIGTVEERNAIERAKIFKKLSSDYKDINYITGKELNL